MNQLYYGDNLDVLRRYIKDETVDLVYLDPPFKSNQDYNVLFAEKDGTRNCAGPTCSQKKESSNEEATSFRFSGIGGILPAHNARTSESNRH